MPAQVFGPEAAVSTLNRALNDQSPSNAVFKNQVSNAGTTEASINAFANTFLNNYKTLTDDALSTKVLTNMGLLPNAELQAALKDYFAANGAANRGIVVLQLGNILSGLESATGSLAVYSAAAIAWNNEVTGAYEYSVNPANTAPTVVSPTGNANTGTSFSLTVNQDTLNGTGANDTYTAGASQNGAGALINTLQGVDALDGGAGTDTLAVTLAQNITVAPTIKNIETLSVRSVDAAAGLDMTGVTGATSVTVADSTAMATVTNLAGIAAVGVSTQKSNVDLLGGTATTLGLTLTKVGDKATTSAIGLGAASKATTLNLTVDSTWAEITDGNTYIATAATVAATGANVLKMSNGDKIATLTTSGAGSVDFTSKALIGLKTLTVGDGGAKVDATGGILETVTAGAGADTVTVVGATFKTAAMGAGNDTVKFVTTQVASSASVDLGAGDDTLSFAATNPAAGATLTGGDGTDTISFNSDDFTSVAGFTAGNLAKITGFETLGINDALKDATTYDVTKIAGIVNFSANNGVTATKSATVSNLGSTTTVTLGGDLTTNVGTLAVVMKDDSGSADVLNLKLNHSYTENNDATATNTAVTENVKLNKATGGVETLNITSTGKASTTFAGTAGTKADTVTNTLALDATGTANGATTTITVSGDQAFSVAPDATFKKLASVDASALTAGATLNLSSSGANDGTQLALTIKGAATAANTITGNTKNDTITGGSKADTITGGLGADAMSGGAGNDVFVYANTNGSDSTLINLDVISDFTANTYGRGTSGAATSAGASTQATERNGDVIDLKAIIAAQTTALNTTTTLEFSVQSNSSDAQTFIQNSKNDTTLTSINAALDSSSGRVYIDVNNDGVIDSVIQLTGVTTLTTAAFLLS